jgi:murein DD-endopeptidase MepM/ murein hydrolase activator NlpD
MRTIHRVGAAFGVVLIAAAPAAVAAAPVIEDADPASAGSTAPAANVPGLGGAVLSDLRAADERAREARRERLDGPFHPVVAATIDYGEAGAEFGASRSGHVHEGQDVFAPSGTPLVAVADGEVVEVGSDGGRGNYVSIHDPAEDRTYNYFHMLEPASVKAGEPVQAGQRVGALGCTGSCFGEHLHFEVRQGPDPYGHAEDPRPFLEELPQAPKAR